MRFACTEVVHAITAAMPMAPVITLGNIFIIISTFVGCSVCKLAELSSLLLHNTRFVKDISWINGGFSDSAGIGVD